MNRPTLTTDELRRCAARLPRVNLAHLPTPLDEVPRFAEAIGRGTRASGSRVFVKRDDCTGLLFGGNKTRHNEFILADALAQGADLLVWGAGVQSNNCRQTAASCAKLGLECRLYLGRTGHGEEVQGNLLLDHLVGAHVEIVDTPIGPELDELLQQRAAEWRQRGRKVYSWDRKRVRPLGAITYALCVAEIVDQLAQAGLKPTAIYSAASGATGAGLFLGKAVLGLGTALKVILPIRWPWDVRADMAEIANDAASRLDLPHRLRPEDIDASLDYVGPGYGEMTPEAREAFALLARKEGILLDPVYTSKAMAAVIDDVRNGRRGPGEVIVFVHTGGQPAVFAYRDEILHA
jgi:1-aminocyclopropane-1-carboxylate deaminase/D-cysteine desulfhydrase-like pyridoxal-dependent ACC family enzyme